MKKKTITILSVLILSTGILMAKTSLSSSIPDYSQSSSKLGTNIEDFASIITSISETPYEFQLLVVNEANTAILADNQFITNPEWDIRDSTKPVNVKFLIQAKGAKTTDVSVNVGIEVSELKNKTITSSEIYINDIFVQDFNPSIKGNIVNNVSSLTDGTGSDTTIVKNTTVSFDKTVSNKEFVDVFSFNIKYGTDETAPAGQYQSDVKISYTAN